MNPNEIVQPIRQDYLSGMSYAAIGEKYEIDPRTAKRYAQNNIPLESLEQRPFASVLDPYKEMIDHWLLNGRIFATIIHDRLIEHGCNCGYTIVNDYVRKKITEFEASGVYKTSMQSVKDKTSYKNKIAAEKQKMKGNVK